MSNKSVLSSHESIQNQSLEDEQRIILHNNLLQRILKLRDKIGINMSLTELSQKLNDLETMIYGGCDLEEVDIEIEHIETQVKKHFSKIINVFRHPIKGIITQTQNIFNRVRSKAIVQEIKKPE